MRKSFVKFIIKIGIATLLLCIVFALVFLIFKTVKFNMGYVVVLVTYLAVVLGLHYYLLQSLLKRLVVFNRTFMILTAIKLVLIVLLMFIISRFQIANFKLYLGELFIIYIVFSIIEVRDVLKQINQINSSK